MKILPIGIKGVRQLQWQGQLVEFLRVAYKVSERHACRLIRLNRTSNRYRHRLDDQAALRIRLKDLATARPRFGYLRLHILLLREGWKINHKEYTVFTDWKDLNCGTKSPRNEFQL